VDQFAAARVLSPITPAVLDAARGGGPPSAPPARQCGFLSVGSAAISAAGPFSASH